MRMNPSTASYVETLKNILKEEHLTAALLWLNENASETQKKGLRLMAAIYKHKGTKRFKSHHLDQTTMKETQIKNAQAQYRKQLYQSNYCKNYGH